MKTSPQKPPSSLPWNGQRESLGDLPLPIPEPVDLPKWAEDIIFKLDTEQNSPHFIVKEIKDNVEGKNDYFIIASQIDSKGVELFDPDPLCFCYQSETAINAVYIGMKKV